MEDNKLDMREYRFKGIRKDNNEWISGSLISFDDGGNNKSRIIAPSKSCVVVDHKKGFALLADAYDIIWETASQYTEKNDINGKRIYEHDIIVDKTGSFAIIRWVNDEKMFAADFGPSFELQPLGFSCKVTGNIFVIQNGELHIQTPWKK